MLYKQNLPCVRLAPTPQAESILADQVGAVSAKVSSEAAADWVRIGARLNSATRRQNA